MGRNSPFHRHKQKLYGHSKWKKLRKLLLPRGRVCGRCGLLLASHLHHVITPFKKGYVIDWKLAFDKNNCEPICHTCHYRHHRMERVGVTCAYCGTRTRETKHGRICDYCKTEGFGIHKAG